ncbi:putative multiple epidermal growth factor-like domains protein 6 [Apostichopus japonicus]|uniref:Putative multiple epidermal growth factor-like domains protein 6 n=1 Tax=Stichopus japonicus TaxID=307972 RepID=A0A2G8KMC8_STIJA|nr:putative multiple epidermal growth factor-like domains protein 6 [Apostichopus japonicus]
MDYANAFPVSLGVDVRTRAIKDSSVRIVVKFVAVGMMGLNPIDGSCSCAPGYMGTYCDLICPHATFGLQCLTDCFCLNNASCQHVTGDCHCAPGFTGMTCINKCPTGTWGLGCLGTCSCPTDAGCDHITGTCICPPGRRGTMCTLPCQPGTFGENCAQQCSCQTEHSVAYTQVDAFAPTAGKERIVQTLVGLGFSVHPVL